MSSPDTQEKGGVLLREVARTGPFVSGCICLRKEATVLEESGSEVSNARSTFRVWSHSLVEEGGQKGDSCASQFAFDGNCGIL